MSSITSKSFERPTHEKILRPLPGPKKPRKHDDGRFHDEVMKKPAENFELVKNIDEEILLRKRHENKRKKKNQDDRIAVKSIDNTMHVGSCASAAINNLLKSACVDHVIGEHEFRTCIIELEATGRKPRGSEKFGVLHETTFEIHVSALRHMFARKLICSGKVRVGLTKCMNRGVWHKTLWLSEQTSGLFLVFGYCLGEGHFIACDANTGTIYDSFTKFKFNLCFNSLLEIFENGIDCAHELYIEPTLK